MDLLGNLRPRTLPGSVFRGGGLAVFLFVVTAVGNQYVHPDWKGLYWGVAIVAIAAVVLIPPGVVAFGRIRLRSVRLEPNFRRWCARCAEMLQRATDQDEVLTYQTPVSLDAAGYDDEDTQAFRRYVRATFLKLIRTDVTYKRIVILYPGDPQPIRRAKAFLAELMVFARQVGDVEAQQTNLANVHVGFVNLKDVLKSVYLNLDMHLTSNTEFAIGFVSGLATGCRTFGGGIYVKDRSGSVNRQLRSEVNSVWTGIESSGDSLHLRNMFNMSRSDEALLKACDDQVDAIVLKLLSTVPVGSTLTLDEVREELHRMTAAACTRPKTGCILLAWALQLVGER